MCGTRSIDEGLERIGAVEVALEMARQQMARRRNTLRAYEVLAYFYQACEAINPGFENFLAAARQLRAGTMPRSDPVDFIASLPAKAPLVATAASAMRERICSQALAEMSAGHRRHLSGLALLSSRAGAGEMDAAKLC
jgi:hypothetical protein